MNPSTVLPGVASGASTAALDARLQQLVSTDVTPGVEEKSASIVSQITTVITGTLGNDTLNLNSSYSPGNWSSPVNGTSIPTSEDEDMAIKRLVVILTNIFVVVAILVTCVLAFRHRKWENMMRSEQQKDPICNYDVVKIEEEDEEEIGEDYEIFEK